MKIPAPAVLAACLFAAIPSFAADNKANPADYPLAVHVSASTYAPPDNLNQTLTATIAGKHYQLLGPCSSAKIYSHPNGLINPGDYHARLSMDEHKTSYESLQQFEILLPDGTTRRFSVIAQSE
jgi:hypothetical protein